MGVWDNVEGKKDGTLYWFGGLKTYREYLVDVEETGYKRYKVARQDASLKTGGEVSAMQRSL
ncbi:Nn.00g103780.m01.CDS01 [Neocucurbitaria sp. VM-36]